MKTSYWWTLIAILFIIIIALTFMLVTTPGPSTETATGATSTTGTTGSTTTAASTTNTGTKPIVTSPAAHATVGKTFTISGSAPGNWYFEASFPVRVLDQQGNVLVQIPAQAQSDWMTTAMVPFTVTVSIASYSGPATIVLSKDNPSGLPQNDASTTIPIVIQ